MVQQGLRADPAISVRECKGKSVLTQRRQEDVTAGSGRDRMHLQGVESVSATDSGSLRLRSKETTSKESRQFIQVAAKDSFRVADNLSAGRQISRLGMRSAIGENTVCHANVIGNLGPGWEHSATCRTCRVTLAHALA